MNILPQKSWHVRTKRNIERVRRDEEKAAEEEKEKQRRIAIAEQEARTELLRDRSKKRTNSEIESGSKPQTNSSLPSSGGSDITDIYQATGHINFFKEAEAGELKSGKNAEHEAEKKAEKEKWEKDIGLLTYLGQSAIETQAAPPWYLAPKKKKERDAVEMATVKDQTLKDKLDPLRTMEAYLQKKKSKHKDKKDKHKHSKHKHKSKDKDKSEEKRQHSSATKSIEQLRAERLKREQEERSRAQQVLSGGSNRGSSPAPERPVSDRERKYNSQYNPEFVRRPREKHSFEF